GDSRPAAERRERQGSRPGSPRRGGAGARRGRGPRDPLPGGQAVIRINLLEETRQQVKAKSGGPKFQVAGSAGVIVLGIGVAAAVAAILVYFMILKARADSLDSQIEKAQVERARLEYVIK